MIGLILASVLSWARALLWGRNGVVVVAIAGLLAAYGWQAAWHRDAGRQAERAEIVERGKKINAKARKRARAADKPGSADRLRRKYCRDC